MGKLFNMYLLIADEPMDTIEAETEEDAINIFLNDPYVREFRDHSEDCRWSVIAEEITRDEDEEVEEYGI